MINNQTDTIKALENEEIVNKIDNDRPNESTGIYIRNFVKIFDPESNKTLIETSN